MVSLSQEFTPAHLKGITIHPDNALMFDFIVQRGDGHLSDQQKQEEYKKLIKYFLASLAVPDEDQWVNLSPYEKDRIIKDDFGKTEMGRDLLAQDYILKQLTASLIYPEDNLGKKFWDKVYTKAQQQYGTTNIPVNTFNKVWIVPDDALIYEKGNTAYVVKNHLKVMLEQDYLAVEKNRSQSGDMLRKSEGIATCPQAGCQANEELNVKATQRNEPNALARQIVREIVLPALEKEVNEGKNFAPLRQVYSGMILAAWYKRALKESLLGKIYADKAKVKGLEVFPSPGGRGEGRGTDVERIYQQYLQAFKKGVYNYIKEEQDPVTQQIIPRKYFSGGAKNPYSDRSEPGYLKETEDPEFDLAMNADTSENGGQDEVTWRAASPTEAITAVNLDTAMTTTAGSLQNWLNHGIAWREWERFEKGDSYQELFSDLLKSFEHIGAQNRNNYIKIHIQDAFIELFHELSGKAVSYKVYGTDKTRGSLTWNDFLEILKARVKDLNLRPGDLVLKNMIGNPHRSIGLIGDHNYLYQIIELWKIQNPGQDMDFLTDRVRRFINNVHMNNPNEETDLADKIAADIAYYYVGRNGGSAGWANPDPEHLPEEIDAMINYIRGYNDQERERIRGLLESGEALKQELLDITADPEIVETVWKGYQAIREKARTEGLTEDNVFTMLDNLSSSYHVDVHAHLWRAYHPAEPEAGDFDTAMLANTIGTAVTVGIGQDISSDKIAALKSSGVKAVVLDIDDPQVNQKIEILWDSGIIPLVPGGSIPKIVATLKLANIAKHRAISFNNLNQFRAVINEISEIKDDWRIKQSSGIYIGLKLPKDEVPAAIALWESVKDSGKINVVFMVEEDEVVDTREMINAALTEQRHRGLDSELNFENVRSVDRALMSPADPLGGIDFNAANLNLQIKRDGKGVPLPLPQQDLEHIKIDGLVPIILEIKPVMVSH